MGTHTKGEAVTQMWIAYEAYTGFSIAKLVLGGGEGKEP
jgi:hypothetical protein